MKGVYLHQFVNVVTNQLMRRNGRQTLELVIRTHVVSLTKGSGQVILDALPSFAFSFRVSGGRSKGRNLKTRS